MTSPFPSIGSLVVLNVALLLVYLNLVPPPVSSSAFLFPTKDAITRNAHLSKVLDDAQAALGMLHRDMNAEGDMFPSLERFGMAKAALDDEVVRMLKESEDFCGGMDVSEGDGLAELVAATICVNMKEQAKTVVGISLQMGELSELGKQLMMARVRVQMGELVLKKMHGMAGWRSKRERA